MVLPPNAAPTLSEISGRAVRCSGDWPLERLFGNEALEESSVPLVELLRAKRLLCIRDFVHLPAWELRDWLLITEDEATHLLSRAWSACAAPPVTAWDLATQATQRTRESSRMAPLPSLHRAFGGLPALLEVAGPPGVGKTQFCLHAAALTAASGNEVFWLDTERSFSAQRLLEMLEYLHPGEAAMQALQRVRHKVCDSLQELQGNIAELCQSKAALYGAMPALLVIDSVASVARREGEISIPKRQAALSSLASSLKVLVAPNPGRPKVIPPSVVVTNQVMGNPGSNARVSLGHVWHHAVNWRLVLSHVPPGPNGLGSKEQADPFGRRYLMVEKSPSCATLILPFNISEQGLTELPP